jgi:hypothetical protein
MHLHARSKPTLVNAGHCQCLTIPTDQASDLHTFLRRHGLRTPPPQPYQTGIDAISLGNAVDVKAIQSVLTL